MLMPHFSNYQEVTSPAQGAALNRAFIQFGWMVLNSHTALDHLGAVIYPYGMVCIMIDLIVAPHKAKCDMQVLTGSSHYSYVYYTLFTSLYLLESRGATINGVILSSGQYRAPIALASSQMVIFCQTDWSAMEVAVQEEHGKGDIECTDTSIIAFELAIEDHLAAITGGFIGAVGILRFS